MKLDFQYTQIDDKKLCKEVAKDLEVDEKEVRRIWMDFWDSWAKFIQCDELPKVKVTNLGTFAPRISTMRKSAFRFYMHGNRESAEKMYKVYERLVKELESKTGGKNSRKLDFYKSRKNFLEDDTNKEDNCIIHDSFGEEE